MEQNEQWTNQVFASIEGMKRAGPSDDLFEKINTKIPKSAQVKIFPMSKLLWAAAAACIIVTLNIFAFSDSIKEGNQTTASEELLLTDFTLYN